MAEEVITEEKPKAEEPPVMTEAPIEERGFYVDKKAEPVVEKPVEVVAKVEAAKPEEAPEIVEYKASTRKRIQTLLDRQKEQDAEIARLKAPPPPPDPTMPVEPDPDTFAGTWDELKAAQKKYATDLVAYETKKAVDADRKAREEAAQLAKVKEQNELITTTWNNRAAKTIERHADFKSLIWENESGKIKTELANELNRTTDEFLIESEVGPDILLVLAKDPEKRQKLFAMGTRETSRELTKMEDDILESLKPKSTVTRAPRPAADVTSGGGGLGKDEPIENRFYK